MRIVASDSGARVPVHTWPKNLRPREKLITHGPGSLSHEELLAIFLRVGNAKRNVIELSSDLLRQVGGIYQLLHLNINDLSNLKGLGVSTWCQLQAAREIVKRSLCEQLQTSNVIHSPSVVREFLQTTMGHLGYEVFSCIFLNAQNAMIGYQELFRGSTTQTAVYPREIIKEALSKNAVCLIVAHNHPSGNPFPSEEDLELTQTLKKCVELFDITLLDHCIVTANGFFSFADASIL